MPAVGRLLLAWAWASVLAIGIGLLVAEFLARAFGLRRFLPGPFRLALLGVAGMTTAATAISLVVPLEPWSHLLLGGLAAGGALRSGGTRRLVHAVRAVRRSLPEERLLFSALLAAGLLWSLVRVDLYDTRAYHEQAIRGAQELRAVPGIANLEPRLALGCSWFVLAAVTDLARPDHAVNGWLLLVVGGYLAGGVRRLRRDRRSPSGWYRLLALPGALLIVNEWLSTPMPDAPVALLWLLSFALALESLEEGPSRVRREAVAFLGILVPFMACLRPSAAPALLLIPWVLVRAGDRPPLARFMGIAAVVSLPVLARNLVLSGLPLFPLEVPALSWPPWRAEDVAERLAVASWARWPGVVPGTAPSGWGWIGPWWERLGAPDRGALLVAVVCGSALVLRERRRLLSSAGGVAAIALLGLGAWFLTAPDPRFARGLYSGLALLALLRFFGRLLRTSTALPAAWTAVALLLLADGTRAGLVLRGRAGHLLPRRESAPAATRAVALGPVTVLTPVVEATCGRAPFPCVALPDRAWPLGDRLEDGFRPRRPDDPAPIPLPPDSSGRPASVGRPPAPGGNGAPRPGV